MFKTEFHLHTARDINLFADLLLDLHETYPSALTIMDAIAGIEGDGLSNGNPRKIGLVLASKSCTALDYVAVTIAGFDPMSVPTVDWRRNEALVHRAWKTANYLKSGLNPSLWVILKKR
jgi:uncharacterized protein (DUF362 family)